MYFVFSPVCRFLMYRGPSDMCCVPWSRVGWFDTSGGSGQGRRHQGGQGQEGRRRRLSVLSVVNVNQTLDLTKKQKYPKQLHTCFALCREEREKNSGSPKKNFSTKRSQNPSPRRDHEFDGDRDRRHESHRVAGGAQEAWLACQGQKV